jgi:Kef-type K+ transport system membrane component KefB
VLSIAAVGLIALKAIGFLFLAIVLGQFLVPRILSAMGRLNSNGVLVTFAIAFCFLLAWCSTKVGLAPIIGAFAAGLVLDEVHYKRKRQRQERDLQTLLRPVSAIFVPVFFVWMGLRVNLSSFARTDTLGFALALTVVAILGKQICSLGVIERTVDRLVIGLGMIPRGEVGLIFASIGATLLLPNSSGEVLPVINSATFAAIIIMVVITTFVTPPALKWSLDRSSRDQT